MSVILIGFMGSGKSTVGRALAHRMQTRFVDLDAVIEAQHGASVTALFREHGEKHFRQMETRALQSVIAAAGVVSTGGGVVTRSENRALLQTVRERVVYLHAQPETLATRIRRQPGTRPLIDAAGALDMEQTVARVRELLASRAPFYRECAGITVESERRSPDDVAREIVDKLGTYSKEE